MLRLALVTSVLLVLALQNSCGLIADDPHPSDVELIDNFSKHETDFNVLVNMANEDSKVVRIAKDFTWLDTSVAWPRPESELGFPKERWDMYRRLFKKLDLEKGLAWYSVPDGPILLLASTRGMVTGGSDKGYAFSTNELSPLFESLDNINLEIKRKKLPANVPVYKRLKDSWYLYYRGN